MTGDVDGQGDCARSCYRHLLPEHREVSSGVDLAEPSAIYGIYPVNISAPPIIFMLQIPRYDQQTSASITAFSSPPTTFPSSLRRLLPACQVARSAILDGCRRIGTGGFTAGTHDANGRLIFTQHFD